MQTDQQPQKSYDNQSPEPSVFVSRKMWIIWTMIAIAVIALTVVLILLLRTNGDSTTDSTIVTESQSHETFSPLTRPADTSQLTYGKWSGELKYGQPHGQGTLTYSQQRLISQFDPKATVAHPGDYIIGEFDNGQLISGKLYTGDGHVTEIVTTYQQ